jgi:hypothetical protein
VFGSTAFAGITNYADTPSYNARGVLKGLHYGNGVEMNITNFNNKLQATNFEVKKDTTSIIKKNYEFYADSSLKYSQDVNDAKFDRSYKYDFQGRTTEAKSGANARGLTDLAKNIPYKQTFGYNVYDNMTESLMVSYSSNVDIDSNTYLNNRKVFTTPYPSSTYDAQGNEITDLNAEYLFDASGEMIRSTPKNPDNPSELLPPTHRFVDGERKELKRIRDWIPPNTTTVSPIATYYIYSSVTRKLVSEVNNSGQQLKTFVTANGQTIAEQYVTQRVYFNHQDASGASLQQTQENGEIINPRTSEFDAVGNNVGGFDIYIDLITLNEGDPSGINFDDPVYGGSVGGNPHLQQKKFFNGIQISDRHFAQIMESGLVGGAFGILEYAARMSSQLVGWRRFNPSRSRNAPTLVPRGGGTTSPNATPDGFYAYADFQTNEGTVRNFYRPVYNDSWSGLSALIMFIDKTPREEVADAIAEASNLLKKEKCKESIDGLLKKAGRKLFENRLKAENLVVSSMSKEEQKSIEDAISENVSGLTSQNAVKAVNELFLNESTSIIDKNELRINKSGHNSAEIQRSSRVGDGGITQKTVTLAIYAGFFNVVMSGKSDITSSVGPATPPKPYAGSSTSLSERAMTILHEGIHAIDAGFSDGFIGGIIKGKDKDLNKDEGSRAISEFIAKNCGK